MQPDKITVRTRQVNNNDKNRLTSKCSQYPVKGKYKNIMNECNQQPQSVSQPLFFLGFKINFLAKNKIAKPKII